MFEAFISHIQCWGLVQHGVNARIGLERREMTLNLVDQVTPSSPSLTRQWRVNPYCRSRGISSSESSSMSVTVFCDFKRRESRNQTPFCLSVYLFTIICLLSQLINVESACSAPAGSYCSAGDTSGETVFAYTDAAVQTYTVPSGASLLEVEAWAGGGGGAGTSNADVTGADGGAGGYSRCVVDVSALTTLEVLVGEGGGGGSTSVTTTTSGQVTGVKQI